MFPFTPFQSTFLLFSTPPHKMALIHMAEPLGWIGPGLGTFTCRRPMPTGNGSFSSPQGILGRSVKSIITSPFPHHTDYITGVYVRGSKKASYAAFMHCCWLASMRPQKTKVAERHGSVYCTQPACYLQHLAHTGSFLSRSYRA